MATGPADPEGVRPAGTGVPSGHRRSRRSQLLEGVWDFAWDGDTATVTVHVRRIREKVEVDPSDPRHVLTVWGVGYRFEP